MNHEMILVLDFGGQYNQLIARRVRECNVYCEVHPYTMSLEQIREMAPKGVYFSVRAYADLLPAERMTVYVNCSPCTFSSGLPAGVKAVAPTEMLQAVRKVVNSLAVNGVSEEVLSDCKTMLTDINRAADMNQAVLLNSALDRASLGRDMRSGYKERIKAAKASDLRDLFAALSDCTCEFVVE